MGSDSPFVFKQFTVEQNHSTMKVGTDAVLLGALANQPMPSKILDIGTGTGVIALMLAQRFVYAQIEGVEIDFATALEARKNFANSPFNARMKLYHLAIQDFHPTAEYDLIVSNPPYFVNALKNDCTKKQLARHTDVFFYSQLLKKIAQLLTNDGSSWLVLPVQHALLLIKEASVYGLYPQHRLFIKHVPNKMPKRLIFSLTKKCTDVRQEEWCIRENDHSYAPNYRDLMRQFLLID